MGSTRIRDALHHLRDHHSELDGAYQRVCSHIGGVSGFDSLASNDEIKEANYALSSVRDASKGLATAIIELKAALLIEIDLRAEEEAREAAKKTK